MKKSIIFNAIAAAMLLASIMFMSAADSNIGFAVLACLGMFGSYGYHDLAEQYKRREKEIILSNQLWEGTGND